MNGYAVSNFPFAGEDPDENNWVNTQVETGYYAPP